MAKISEQTEMNHIVEQTLLYDFYGELLTEHQKEIYEDVVWNDMSLTEIAESQGVSRQAISDLMKRINKLLAGYEEKLQLVAKFTRAKEKVSEIHEIAEQLDEEHDSESQDKKEFRKKLIEIEKISSSILEDF